MLSSNMKPFQFTFLALFVVAAAPSLRASEPSHPAAPTHVSGKPKDKEDEDKKESTKPPFKGMTKAQARHF